jgi:hypothetical protein
MIVNDRRQSPIGAILLRFPREMIPSISTPNRHARLMARAGARKDGPRPSGGMIARAPR